jgi:hypothetical protein
MKTLCVIETVNNEQKPIDLVLTQSVWGIWLMVRTGKTETMVELDRTHVLMLQKGLKQVIG